MSKERFDNIYVKYITRPGFESMYEWLESTDFFTAPASSIYHNNFQGGLVDHSVNVFEQLVNLLRIHTEIKVTAESTAIVSLLHDVCKADYYELYSRNVKINGQWEAVPAYRVREQKPIGGHGSKSLYLIQKHMTLTDEEASAILCHMGRGDDTSIDFGKAFRKYPLSFLTHLADGTSAFIKERIVETGW